jgi:hypothetical protein
LPETLAASFEKKTEAKLLTRSHLKLTAGRYLICFKNDKVKKPLTDKSKMKIRVQRKF